MRLIDADNLRGRVCEIFLCAEPGSAEERRLALVLGLIDSERTIAPPPHDPLTLEELWEMDGEPVWNDTMKKWYFVVLSWEHGPVAMDYKGAWRPLDDRYYRRKPEEA